MRTLAWAALIAGGLCLGGIALRTAATAAEREGWVGSGTKSGALDWRGGWLKQNVAGPDDAPPYAIVDREGRLRCLLEPADDLDLGPYINEHVRIQGPSRWNANSSVPIVQAVKVRALTEKSRPAEDEQDDLEEPRPRRMAAERTGERAVERTVERDREPRHRVERAAYEESGEPRRLVRQVAAEYRDPRYNQPRSNRTQDPRYRASLPRGNERVAQGTRRIEPTPADDFEEVPAGPRRSQRATSPIPEGALEDDGAGRRFSGASMAGGGPVYDGPVYDGGEFEGELYDDGGGYEACDNCGPRSAPYGGARGGNRWGQRAGCCGPFPSRFWVRAEYLLWETDGMHLPALVTTSPAGTLRENAGVLDQPDAQVLYGNRDIFTDSRSGGRIRFGTWMDERASIGLQGEFFVLDNEEDQFSQSSTGTPILARPFFDVNQGVESAELIAFPGLIRGTVDVNSSTQFLGAGVLGQFNVVCQPRTWCDPRRGHTCCGGVRVAVLGGYRFLRLDDGVTIREDLTSLDAAEPGSFLIEDNFDTTNQFHGADIGLLAEWRRCRWSLELLTRIAVGNTRETVHIRGSTAINEGGATETFNGGILAQTSNIGRYTRDKFAVVPELGVTVGYQLAPHWRLTVGYTFLYWSQVARAGDQIDLDLNTNLIPPQQAPVAGAGRPRFVFKDTDFWAQGLHAGVECQW